MGIVFAAGLWSVMPQHRAEAAAAAFQSPPIVLKASDVLPPELRSGPGFNVQEQVENDGLINIYRVKTPSEGYRVEGTLALLTLVGELRALRALDDMKGSSTFKDAVKRSATKPLDFGKGLIEDPGRTLKGAVTGVGRWFGDVERAVVSNDPHQQNALETALGQAATKRQLAFQFGVDPYTNFRPLEAALNEVAWTSVAGGLPLRVVLMAAGGVAGAVVNTAGSAESMRTLVRDNSPAELEKINAGKLGAMGARPGLTEALLRNPYFTPYEMTLMVGALEEMRATRDRPVFLETAAEVQEEAVARFMRVQAQLYAAEARSGQRGGRFVALDGKPYLLQDEGELSGIFPLDYVAWTPRLQSKERAISQAAAALPVKGAKQLVVTGQVSPAARKELEARGWKVRDRLGLELIGQGAAKPKKP
jgi:hypothetical protein